MRLTQQLALVPLTVISLLVFIAHGIPREGSATDTLALSGRDDTANYTVYPKDTQNEDQAAAIYNLLIGVVSDPTTIFNSTTDHGTQHWFWGLPLTSAHAEKVKGNSNITAVVQECTSNCSDPTASDDTPSSKSRQSDDSADYIEESRLVKRDGHIVNAHNVDEEVAFISRPLKKNLGPDFVYDNTAGTDQTVYIVDTGAGLGNNDEFSRYVAPNKRYLQARGATASDGLENDVSTTSHGTGVLAKVAGWKHGVAKRSKPVIVRVCQTGDPAAWLGGIEQAYEDWLLTYEKNKKTATAILNISWGWSDAALAQSNFPGFIGDVWKGQLEQILKKCIGIGLLPILASGNGRFNPPVNEYPQLLAYPSNGQPPAVPNMMVVGGVTVDGDRWDGSKVDPPGTNPPVITLHAPSFNINVPQKDGGWRNPLEVQGVSYAAGTVSGLGAYFLGLSSLSSNLANDDPIQRVIRLKQQLGVLSSLERGNVISLYNLADPDTCPPDIPPPDFQNGDEVPCKDTSTHQGNTVVAIPNCYIMTASALPSLGISTPSPQCSCTGGEIAGIGSGTVSGTTYSWCQTGDLPSGVPTEATALPTAQPKVQPTSKAPAPGPTQSCKAQLEVQPGPAMAGPNIEYYCICNIGPTPQPTIVNNEYTCPTKPPANRRGLERFSG